MDDGRAPQDQRWIGARQVLFGQLRDARTELRGVLGIPQDATPASAADRLYAAARALDAGRRAEAVTALGSEAALTRLEALPYMPRVAQATNVAQSELGRLMGDDPTAAAADAASSRHPVEIPARSSHIARRRQPTAGVVQ
jgi:hypothetical protein